MTSIRHYLSRRVLLAAAAVLWLFAQGSPAFADTKELHVLLIVDTNASKRGGEDNVMRPAMQANLKRMQDLINDVYASDNARLKDRLFLNIITGDDVSPAKIREFFQKMPYNADRAWLVYYAGHGGTDPDKGHYFATSGGDILRAEVYHLVDDLGPRAIFLMSDCCSNYAPATIPAQRAAVNADAFYSLFYQTDGLVNFTAATKGELGWVTSTDGGYMTLSFAHYLRQSGLRGANGKVTWNDLFPLVRNATNDLFQQAKNAAPEGSAIKNAQSQVPEAFNLGGWPKQYRRQLVVKNNTQKTIYVYVEYYDLNFTTNQWQWYQPTQNGIRYEIAPGASHTLRHNSWLIGANRMRIWASSSDGTQVWEEYRNKEVNLAGTDGYNGSMGQFTFTFNP